MKDFPLNKILLYILTINILTAAQTNTKDLFSQKNILKFADYLYSEHDYLRAILEYERYLRKSSSDTVIFKIAEGYLNMGKFRESKSEYSKLFNGKLHSEAVLGYAKSEFFNRNFSAFRNPGIIRESGSGKILKLKYLSFLYTDEPLPDKGDLLSIFPDYAHSELEKFYTRKLNPEYKSELKAALLSTILPGAGKIYTGNYGDGITAFIVTSVLGYISYDNFKADHDIRGWIFSGITSLFYAGNIYGSAAAAQIHNAAIKLNYKQDLDLFLKNNKYFLTND